MDNKDLITRFAEDCFRFETLHQEIDSLIAEADSEVLAYEYEDLANQAAEIVLKLSANGNNVGENFYRYYVERLEYIIAYFRALLDYEETPLAEDEPNELDDEPAAETHFEGFPAGCVFPPPPPFVYKKWELQFPPMTKDEENAATDEAGAVEEDDSEDEQSDEVDNENDAQATESDEAADDHAAGAPISEADISLLPGVDPITESAVRCWERLSSKERAEVRDTFSMWVEMNYTTGRVSGGGDYAEAVKELDDAAWCFDAAKFFLRGGYPKSLVHNEQNLRKMINKAIDAIPGFRESEKFKELIERYPTYKEIEQ
jgi:hypothetical protein